MEFKSADKKYKKRAYIISAIIFCVVQLMLIILCTQIYHMRKFAPFGYIVWSLLTGINIFLLIRQIFLVKNYAYLLTQDCLEIKGGFAVKYLWNIAYEDISALKREPILKKSALGLSKAVVQVGEIKMSLRCIDDYSLNQLCEKCDMEDKID